MTGTKRRRAFAISNNGRRSIGRPAGAVRTTLGELIVAAFEIVGNRVPDVARLLGSPELGRASHGRIVLVQ